MQKPKAPQKPTASQAVIKPESNKSISTVAKGVHLNQKSSSGIFIKEIRIRNFRCLHSIDVELDELTVLVGQNNSGKTSFLSALFAAIGAGQRTISADDIFLYRTEVAVPKDRWVAIDILIRPTDTNGQITNIFPIGSPWLELWGNGVVQDDANHDLVAIRTSYKWNDVKGEYILERRFLKDWQTDSNKWEDSKPIERAVSLSTQQIEPLAMYLLDAKRDIAEDLRSRSSFWSKMVEDHGLSQTDVDRIEEELSQINKDIVESSDVFSHIQTHLKGFHETLSCDQDSIAITPLVRHLRDLSRGMDVVLSTRGAPVFPLQQQGMGTRSLGTFFTFWAFTTWRQKQAKSSAIHPMMALEEPETHLHPQAQRALFNKISCMPGQRIISTHSPYICGQATITHMRHFSKMDEKTVVSRIDLGAGGNQLSTEDLRKIDRQVMNTRGDMLFARALVFFEGETEEQALPDFAENYWQTHPNELGCSFIGVSGNGNYLPFLRMAESFKIPWFIFSDGEDTTIAAVNAALEAIEQQLIPNNSRVFVLPEKKDFEAYIINQTSKDILINAIIEHQAKNLQHKEALKMRWNKKSESEQLKEIESILDAHKTQYGAQLGKILPIPAELNKLFKELDNILHLAQRKAMNS